VHVEGAQRLVPAHDEPAELLRVLSGLRWRLGFERTLLFGVRGALAGGLALIGLSIAAWLTETDTPGWLAAMPVLAALAFSLARWPSHRQAALAADRRLDLEERLGTAVELARGARSGRFDGLQVQDAIRTARSAPRRWLTEDRRLRREAALAAGVLVLAAASLLLARLPAPRMTTAQDTAVPVDAAAAADVAERTVPAGAQDSTLMTAQPAIQTPADADLANRVQQEQSEQVALDKLSKALSSVSAGQPAANAIQQGDFAAARDELQSLGDEADQLSDAAKQQLARALQDAAASTPQADRQLADRERQAGQALSRSNYNDQRQALRGLGDQVERSGARSVPADQLARDMGKLQQQQSAASQGGGGRSQAPANGMQSNSPSGAQSGQGTGAATGAQGGGSEGQQGGPGAGTGSDPNVAGDPSRLDTAGERVQVPTRLGSGPGVRPPDGSEDQVGADPLLGGRTVAELARSQQTGQVAPEQNLVPGEQRPVVRGYFR
jgi:hypothetical protein